MNAIGLIEAEDARPAIDPAMVRAQAGPPRTLFVRARVFLKRIAAFAYELLTNSP